MKSIYKLLAVALVLASLSVGLVACGGNPTTPEPPTESPSPEGGTN